MRHAGSVAAARYESWVERGMEQRLRIDTAGIDCDLARLGVARADLVHAYAYQPVQLRVFARIIRAAAIEPADYVMVDFGSRQTRGGGVGAGCTPPPPAPPAGRTPTGWNWCVRCRPKETAGGWWGGKPPPPRWRGAEIDHHVVR